MTEYNNKMVIQFVLFILIGVLIKSIHSDGSISAINNTNQTIISSAIFPQLSPLPSLNQLNNIDEKKPSVKSKYIPTIFHKILRIPHIKSIHINSRVKPKNNILNYSKLSSKLSNETNDIPLILSNLTSEFSVNNLKNGSSLSSLPSFVLSSDSKQNVLINSLATPSDSSTSQNKTVKFFNPITHSILAVPLIISAESTSPSLSHSPSNSSASQSSLATSKFLPPHIVVSKSFERPAFLKDQCIEIHKLDSGAYSAIGCAPFTISLPCVLQPGNMSLAFPSCCPDAYCPPDVKVESASNAV